MPAYRFLRYKYCHKHLVDLTSAVIIYLTCGSPVAMHYLYSRPEIGPLVVLNSVTRLLFWPIFVGLITFSTIKTRIRNDERQIAEKARTLRNELESMVRESWNTSAIFELRSIFDRYFALAAAVSVPDINNGSSEFLNIAEHPKTDLAKRCLNRKMAAKVSASFIESRGDLVSLLSSETISISSDLEGFVSKLSKLAGDTELETLVSHNASNDSHKFERRAA
ncbi:MAG TPA: hypothetical protein PKA82_05140 [Pyrinomonadaceae bacterium]|nr:hypothetical protein [Pyrinomonadaceae bacterium]